MGNVRRIVTEDLPDDVEGYYWRRGWVVGLLCGLALWGCSAADGWRIAWIILFSEGGGN